MTDEAVNVKFGAELAGLLGGLTQAQSAVAGTVEQMNSKLALLGGTFGTILKALEGIVAALAGGAIFKKFIDETNELNAASTKMARALGITGEEASILGVALRSVGIDTDEFSAVNQRFARQLFQNEQRMIDWGLRTRDANGHLRDQRTLFQEALGIIGGYREGINRTEASMALLGSRISDVNKFLKLTPEAQAKAREEAEKLNLVMSAQSQQASRDYKLALAGADEVLKGVSKTIGEAFIPEFTRLLTAFREMGPEIVETTKTIVTAFKDMRDDVLTVFKGMFDPIRRDLAATSAAFRSAFGSDGDTVTVLQFLANIVRGINALFTAFRVATELAFHGIASVADILAARLAQLAAVANLAIRLDWKGALRAWQQGAHDLDEAWAKSIERTIEIARKGAKDINDALVPANKVVYEDQVDRAKGRIPGQGGGQEAPQTHNPLAKALADQAAALAKAELAFQKESLKAQEAELDNSYKRRLISIHAYYAEKQKLDDKNIDNEITAQQAIADAAKKSMAEAGKDSVKRTEAETKFKEANLAIITLSEKRMNLYTKNRRDEANAEEDLQLKIRGTADELAKSLGEKSLQNQEAVIKQRSALLQQSKQDELTALRKLEADKLTIQLRFLDEELARTKEYEIEKRASLYKQQEEARADYNNRLLALDREMELDRKKYALEAQSAIESSFTSFIENIANGTKSLRSAWLSLIADIEKAIIKMMAQQLVRQFFGEGTAGGGFLGSILGAIGLGAVRGAGGGGGGGGGGAGSIGGAGEVIMAATGGPITKGMSYLVGENGPERFVPNVSGTMIPNGAGMGDVNVQNTFHITGPVDTRTQLQIAAAAGRSVGQAVRRNL